MSSLAGKTALVTGGGRGLGRAVAVCLAGLGVRTTVLARTRHEVDETLALIHAADGDCCGFTADIGEPGQVRVVFDQIGPVDIVINNAAVTSPVGRTAEVDPDTWLKTFAINLGGTFMTTRLALPGMVARDWGRIVNVTSGAGSPPGLLRASAYAASKAAVNQLTCNLAAELAEDQVRGVTVCAVDPGTIDTAMQHYMHGLPVDTLGPSSAAEFRHVHANGLLQDPRNPAQLVVGAALGAVSGEILVMGTARAHALISELSGPPTPLNPVLHERGFPK